MAHARDRDFHSWLPREIPSITKPDGTSIELKNIYDTITPSEDCCWVLTCEPKTCAQFIKNLDFLMSAILIPRSLETTLRKKREKKRSQNAKKRPPNYQHEVLPKYEENNINNL